MESPREYVKPTVTKVEVQPDESVILPCKPMPMECSKVMTTYGS